MGPWGPGGKHLWIKFQWPSCCLSLCKSPTNSAPRNSTLFFGCNPSVDEYFSMGQPPWTLKIPKLGLPKFPRGIFFSGTGSGKKSCQHEPGYQIISKVISNFTSSPCGCCGCGWWQAEKTMQAPTWHQSDSRFPSMVLQHTPCRLDFLGLQSKKDIFWEGGTKSSSTLDILHYLSLG